MILTSTLYHHQKVRAAGCMMKSILKKSGKFDNVLNYLNYTDDMVFCLDLDENDLNYQLNILKNRVLPKRAFCFSSHTLYNASGLKNIMTNLESEEIKDEIIAIIANYIRYELKHDINNNEIWIDSPAPPKFKEASQCLIKSDSSKDHYISLRDVFPTDDWGRAFSENKWKGFVYTMPENCEYVAKASKYVFEEIFQTKFNQFAIKLCKIDVK